MTPIKGTVWEHSRRKDYAGNPRKFVVTSVRQDTIHSVDTDRFGIKVKTSVKAFDTFCAKVISVPAPKEKVQAKPAMTEAQCRALFAKAHDAGMVAGIAASPVPMHVVQRANPFDDNSAIVRDYGAYSDGVCGFAYVTLRPANSKFAQWLKKNKNAFNGYYGGMQMSVFEFNQSMERKAAYANAFADVLREAGLNAGIETRMD